jgi:hypothetical protein
MLIPPPSATDWSRKMSSGANTLNCKLNSADVASGNRNRATNLAWQRGREGLAGKGKHQKGNLTIKCRKGLIVQLHDYALN